ncbi:TldD/PmbA family protein [Rhodoplanes sp. TEM]|uniref:TldD/PmbA family protein n=1 Tax=Rhodoplanes tepidamans TaxID=200616 RepID=A0ABT5J4G2_RHOTP|nr:MULTISPECIES: TldD/PmbA family protein [Rhodoplanes]MDC7784529.1 TldD/PmbA family protein [Rhodoplanes tepidamans]MDC7984436.1 TldD/PmbA family protein [Rhodoplanes sp. TEM]MDQ0355757.1 PmbA protein [Rhodoplanes tepidamans]
MSSLFDQSALVTLAELLVAAARRAGADAADAIATRGVSLSVDVRDGTVEESTRSEDDDLGLRVLVGRRQAVVSTNDLARDGVDALAERAVAMARVAPEDPYAGLADPALLARDFPDLDLVDHTIPDVGVLEARAQAAEAAGLAVPGVSKSGGASASAGIGGMVLVTSTGFTGIYVGSRHSVAMTAIAGEGTKMEQDHDWSSAVHASDLDDPQSIGRTAGERAVKRLDPRKVSTRKVPVVYAPRVAGSLVSHLVSAVNGASIARKTSLLRDKLGQRIFSPGIRIIDDPLRRRGLRSHPFDAEGVAGRRLALVDDGVITTWILDCATARELGMTTTGHAQRGVSSTPSPSASNVHLEAGAETAAELIGDISDGLYVTDLIGMGVNMVTGDYSRGAAGFWIENGTLTYPVSEVTIAGNLIDMFATLRPANDLAFRYGVNAPTVRVEGLTVAGV